MNGSVRFGVEGPGCRVYGSSFRVQVKGSRFGGVEGRGRSASGLIKDFD